jgi:hypothetical protein
MSDYFLLLAFNLGSMEEARLNQVDRSGPGTRSVGLAADG